MTQFVRRNVAIDLTPLNRAAYNKMVTSPTMVGPVAIDRHRAAKIRSCEQSHIIAETKFLHGLVEADDTLIDFALQTWQVSNLAGMGVKAAKRDEEYLPIDGQGIANGDRIGNRAKLASQRAVAKRRGEWLQSLKR